MKNQFKHDIAAEEIDTETRPKESEQIELPKSFFTLLFADGIITKQAATNMLPFIVFIAFLAMLYIGNHHHVENSIRKIDKLNKEVAELSWDYKTLKAELMLKSTQTEVSKKVDSLGLIEPVNPPRVITTN